MKNLLTALTALVLTATAQAQFSVPTTFSAGSPIRASEMNANFSAVQTQLRRISGFIHTATAANIDSGYITCIDNPLTNGDPNAVVLANHSYVGNYLTKPIAVWYDGSKWCIYSEDTTQNIPVGEQFSVLVFKP